MGEDKKYNKSGEPRKPNPKSEPKYRNVERKPRRMRLTRLQQLEIARWIDEHPEETLEQVQYRFHVSATQIHTARKKYHAGQLEDPPPQTNDAKRLLDEGVTLQTLIEQQINLAAAQIQVIGEKLDVDRRVRILESLIDVQKSHQAIQLQSHLKRVDADIIAFIYRRRVNAGLTNDEIVRLYREDFSLYEAENKTKKGSKR